MPSDSAFVAHLLELLEPLGGVAAKRMFGGHGIFREGLMFALVADGVCDLKTDAENRPDFESIDLPPFCHESKDGKVTVMSYHRCPETALDSPQRMRPWAESAFAAAVRNDRGRRRKAG
jgi:DNA transformation protein